MEHIVLSHESALEFWRLLSCRMLSVDETDVTRCRSTKEILKNTKYLAFNDAVELFETSPIVRQLCKPLHVVVAMGSKCAMSSLVTTHTMGGTHAPGTFYKVTEDIYVCSPEMVYIQLQRLGIVPALMIAHELCGTYVDSSVSDYSCTDALQVTTARKIREFTEKTEHCRYAEQARRMARFIKDNSASPMESRLSIEYGLPRSRGGRGFPEFELNHKTLLSPKLQKLHGSEYLKSDLFWPKARVGCEYDSWKWHNSEEKIADDYFRSAVLETAGITCLSMRPKHVFDCYAADQYAEVLRRQLGLHKRRDLTFKEYEKKMALREELYGGKREGISKTIVRSIESDTGVPDFDEWIC